VLSPLAINECRSEATVAATKVYRYDFYDPVLKCDRRSVDYATGDAIMAMRATILSDTERSVDERQLDRDGTIRCDHVFADGPPPPRARHETRRAA
jgi:hypothetical protein